MTRGNQRELARVKNQKKQQDTTKNKKGKDDGLTVQQRKERDADVMRQKQLQKPVSKSTLRSLDYESGLGAASVYTLCPPLKCKLVESIKCYQCRSDFQDNCEHEPDNNFLIECPKKSESAPPWCRKIDRSFFFTQEKETSVIRVCAYVYDEAACYGNSIEVESKQTICDCNTDACNGSSELFQRTRVVFLLKILSLIFKL